MKKLILLTTLLLISCGTVEESIEEPTEESIIVTSALSSQAYPIPDAYPGLDNFDSENQSERFSGEPPTFPGIIAFHSTRSGSLQLYLLDGASGTTIDLPTNALQAYEPAWSPDCQSILYTHQLSDPKDLEIYVIGADGVNSDPLMSTPRPETLDWAPAWSPHANKIAYQTNPNTLLNVCFTDKEGADLGCLENDNYSNAQPVFSPDGKKLAFASNKDGDWEINVTNIDDPQEIIQLTNNHAVDLHPSFSPDGEYIVFESNQTGDYDIFLMKSDGSSVTQLTFYEEDDREPVWVGNDQVMFTSYYFGDWELFSVNRDGSSLTQVTFKQGDDKGPVWCASN